MFLKHRGKKGRLSERDDWPLHFAFPQLLPVAKGERAGRYGNKRVASASALGFEGGTVGPGEESVVLRENRRPKPDLHSREKGKEKGKFQK